LRGTREGENAGLTFKRGDRREVWEDFVLVADDDRSEEMMGLARWRRDHHLTCIENSAHSFACDAESSKY